MKIKSAEFKLSAPDLESCPASAWPEFAFIGRSNVGKSSLINALCGRRDLAKVSATPGKTRLINFFAINGRWHLVDLPGYGYASGGRQERALFNEAVGGYLEHRPNIVSLFVLIDSRLPPQEIDLDFIDWLIARSLPFVLVFTKTDKQSALQTGAKIALFKQTLTARHSDFPEFFVTSAKEKTGTTELRAFIERALAGGKSP
jgi:GTP-binding protein